MRTIACLMILFSLPAMVSPPQERAVEAAGPNGPLRGAMVSAAGRSSPIILMIPGSGPTDRDGNNRLGVKAAPLKLLAEALVQHGITTVRIDKRGMFASAGAVPDPNAVTIDDYATDVQAWVASIRQQTGVKCVWLLGHSEGGLVALRAGQSGKDICGLILIATPGRPLGTVLRDQLKANPANAPILDQANSVISQIETGKHVDVSKLNPALAGLFRPNVQDFLINAMALDPAQLASSYHGPIFILQGDRDIQVTVEDAQLLKRANAAATMVLLSDTNHVLKTVTSGDRAANMATYTDPGLPLAPQVVPSIVRFVNFAK